MSWLPHPVSDQFFWGMMFGVFVAPIVRRVLEWCVTDGLGQPHKDRLKR